jgi:pimeloyl-ACP methyl ester carboxylesterase
MKSRFFLLTFLLVSGSCLKAQVGIDRGELISIGGLKQFIHIKGKDNTKPLLLFLHGGPGGSVMSYADKFTKKLQEHFVVIQWDQRETGKTLEVNASAEPLTVALFQKDTRELIDTLLKRFVRPKLFLAGYSWGTYLGFQMAKTVPDLLYAYIAISPMIHQAESERMILERMKEKAEKSGNKKQFSELDSIHIPFENGAQLYIHRKALFEYTGSKAKLSRDFVLKWSATWLSLFNEASRENLLKSLPEIACPVYFFAGRKDHQTSFRLTEAYYNRVVAPKKNLFWFERSAHTIPSTEPALLQETILSKILPECYPQAIK